MVHACCLGSPLYVPALQLVGWSAPTEQKVPSGHTRQSESLVMGRPLARKVAFVEVPFGQGRAAAAPALQKEPGGQSLHAVWLSSSWYLPASHLEQMGWPSRLLYVPCEQADGFDEPTGQKVPEAQVLHWLLAVITGRSWSECVPSGHGTAAEAPAGQ